MKVLVDDARSMDVFAAVMFGYCHKNTNFISCI